MGVEQYIDRMVQQMNQAGPGEKVNILTENANE
jgi:hypothetical protein